MLTGEGGLQDNAGESLGKREKKRTKRQRMCENNHKEIRRRTVGPRQEKKKVENRKK
jgi:hypothetical protein